jgi:uncharacterized membrane protein YdjX (TVP38/TMEM64 family)
LYANQGWFFGNRIFTEITAAKNWFQDEAPFSIIVYYIVFSLCALVLIPYGPFCIAIGFIFGLWWGLLIQMIAIILSAALLFFVGRYGFKDKVCAAWNLPSAFNVVVTARGRSKM